MLPKPFQMIWGNLCAEEIKKFGLLSLSLMFTIGPYWMLRGIREALFIDMVGLRWQPVGKIVAFSFIIPLVLFYSKLIDLVKKEKLFSIIYTIFVTIFVIIAFFDAYPNYITLTPQAPLSNLFSWIPGKAFGWFCYVAFESFGALAPALFWSFVASTTTTDSAKRGYGMIISITQIGTISGTLLVANYSQKLGLPLLILIAAFFIALVPFIIQLFTSINTQQKPHQNQKKRKPKTGFWEGLRLLIKKPYLMGIFVITTGYEVVGTILEFQMNLLGHEAYPTKEAFAGFYARYGLYTNTLAVLFACLGTSFFLRKFGLRICLLIFPIATIFIITSVRIASILPIIVIAMIILKALSYSLNNPSREILYIPTSKDAKFKAKSWIDVFGVRSIKASGAGINAIFSNMLPIETIAYTTPILLVIVSVWAFIARLVGNKFHSLTKENKIIK